jgi:hypothetical protein
MNTNSDDDDIFLYSTNRILLGVFDRHAALGELVLEYTATTLPPLLAQKLTMPYKNNNHTKTHTKSSANNKTATTTAMDEIAFTKQAIKETFVELDKTAPAEAEKSGCCTESIVLQQGESVYARGICIHSECW